VSGNGDVTGETGSRRRYAVGARTGVGVPVRRGGRDRRRRGQRAGFPDPGSGVADTIRCAFPVRRRRFPYDRRFAGPSRAPRPSEPG